MRRSAICACAVSLFIATHAFAHRLDEYLQATTIAIERSRIHAQVRFAPGMLVFPLLLATMDTDRDGAISEAEQGAYAREVLRDLSLSVDGERSPLRLFASAFPPIDALREGRGFIQLDFDAEVPRGGPNRKLLFENHHLRLVGAYLVNALVPNDPDIQLSSQDRSYDQSTYTVDYVDAAASGGAFGSGGWSDPWAWLGPTVLVLMAVSWRWRRNTTAAT
jgi:hypothetical protein